MSRHGFGAIGVICTDQRGGYMGASAIVFRYISDPTTLGALAVREAMDLADDLYIQRIHVASDCKVVADDIQKRNMASYGDTV